MNKLLFPHLNLEFNINPTAFTLFGLEVKWYGILIAIGILLAVVYASRKFKAVGLDENRTFDVIIAAVFGAVIGARLYYVFTTWENYKGDFMSIIDIRDGGLAIYGGIIGALLVAFVVAKIRKVFMPALLDLAGVGFLIGQAIGRWGNFVNQEAFGENTNFFLGMTSSKIQNYLAHHAENIFETTGVVVDPTMPVHPCFFYESLWCILGFVLLHFYFKHRKFDGEVFMLYVAWYGIGRFFIEGIRTDSLMLGDFRISQLLAGVTVVIAIVAIIIIRRKIAKTGYTFYVDSDESKELIAQSEKEAAAYKEKSEAKKAARAAKKETELTSDQKILDEDDAEKKIEEETETTTMEENENE